jgi:hypothetical protein
MSKERELLGVALDFLDPRRWLDPADQHVLNILTRDIKELLAQPETEQEPAAWMWTRKYGDGGYINEVFQFLCDAEECAKDSRNLKIPDIITPLYTSPPKREPLSDKDIADFLEPKHEVTYSYE